MQSICIAQRGKLWRNVGHDVGAVTGAMAAVSVWHPVAPMAWSSLLANGTSSTLLAKAGGTA